MLKFLKNNWFLFSMILGILLGIAVGFAWPGASALEPLGTLFINMMFCVVRLSENGHRYRRSQQEERVRKAGSEGESSGTQVFEELGAGRLVFSECCSGCSFFCLGAGT